MAQPAHDLEMQSVRAVPPAFVTMVVLSAAVLLAGLVSVVALTTTTGAATSPSDAVTALLNAASTGNVTAMLDTIDPVERSAIAPAVTTVVSDLEKDGILDQGTDLSHIPGVSATVTAPTTKTEDLSGVQPGLTAVVFTGGSAAIHVDPSQLPLGTLVKGFLGQATSTHALDTTVALGGPQAEDHPIVTIQRGDQTYVSLGYTVAEWARRAAGQPLPNPSSAVPAVGESSAEAVARTLVSAVTAGDLTRVIELTAPEAAAPLHDYAGLLPHGATHALPVKVTSLDLATSPVDGGTLVSVTDFSATVGSGEVVTLTPQGCLSFTGGTAGSHQMCAPAGTTLLSGYGIVAVEHGSTWYLDPYRSVLDNVEHALSSVNLSTISGLLKTFGSGGGLGSIGSFGGLLKAPDTASSGG
ncbi:MAG TPA: hypothetical protein VGI06_18560 [Acidimicrobiales bacterium]